MPLKARPVNRVSSISWRTTGLSTASPMAAQRLGWSITGRAPAPAATRLSATNRKMQVADVAARPEATSSGSWNPAGPLPVRASRPPRAGPKMKPTL